jgi:hypothetical protein
MRSNRQNAGCGMRKPPSTADHRGSRAVLRSRRSGVLIRVRRCAPGIRRLGELKLGSDGWWW